MKKAIGFLSVLLLVCASWAQPSKSKPNSGPSYQQRVQIISDELKPQIADLWKIYGDMETLNATMQKHIARNGDASAADKDEWNKLKNSLSSTVQAIRNNTKRLRSISPVPRALKKFDDRLVTASFELDEGMESLLTWTTTPSPEMNLQLGREIRKGITSWTNARIALSRATDPAVKAKVYTE